MATLQTPDANIFEADEVNWRLIVYPVLGLLVLLGVGLAIYYYQLSQRDDHETEARAAILKAKGPEDLVQVADRFHGTTQADFALIGAADVFLSKKDFANAEKNYGLVADAAGTDPLLRDSARLGLASALEADKKFEDSVKAFLTVARRGGDSPYAPFAYASAARLYQQMNDRDDERRILTEAAGLGGDSAFTKESAEQLKALNQSAQTPAAKTGASAAPAKTGP